ncbi:helix-turn-helix domain-containing protein [Aerococcaceae bacterium NML160702]|nr:helix-turn-helix domain-containing protein [Aerococcaceae bacterium NML160702]
MVATSRLEVLRTKRNWTQTDLAKKLHTTQSAVGHWENGRRNIPQDKLIDIAKIFGVSTDYILGVDDSPAPYYALTDKDEKDIAKTLEKMIENLDGLRYSKEEAEYSDETRELLIGALEQAARIAKMEAKRKFTPKKYRGGEQ